MKRTIAIILASTVLIFAGSAGAADLTVYMCTDLSGDDCTSSEVPQTITEDRNGDPVTDGLLERNESDEGARSFTVYVDASNGSASNVCKIEASLAFDRDTLVPDGSTNLGVASSVSGGVTTSCNTVHGKSAPAGWPGLTSVYICKIAETDWASSPEGDLVLDDGGAAAEMSAEFNVKLENAVAGARTGLGAVVLKTVRQYTV
ncbi:MAG: hypothetical protein JRE57_10435 [Deltaproteobacteria bacterium]|nr:hypothetical protein [Deltaproteobacteria bacterium]